MKFQRKIVGVYMLFSLIIIIFFGVISFGINLEKDKEQEYSSVAAVSAAQMQQMDEVIRGMDSAMSYFLSDAEVLNALEAMSRLNVDTHEQFYFDSAVSTLRNKISNYYLMTQFYRFIIFNPQGYVLTNTNYKDMMLDKDMSYQTYPWLSKVCDKGGKNVLLGLHADDWGGTVKPEVVSVAKEIQGSGLGCLEIQMKKETLDDKFLMDDNDIDCIFFDEENQLFYADSEDHNIDYYIKQLDMNATNVQEIESLMREKALCIVRSSPKYGITSLTIKTIDIEKKAMDEVLPSIVLLLFGSLFFSVSYIYVTSQQLTKPIKQLKNFMETTSFENIGTKIPKKISNDEIESLYESYRKVLKRLKESVTRERRLSFLQLQAQFDLLQAQVNPHFLYNVLNVISSRGVICDDEVICDICKELALMLRYATNTKKKYATIKEEIAYLNAYFTLLKYRYDYKLTYVINIEEHLYDKIIPKIVVQQIAENAVKHGYQECESMTIKVTGGLTDAGWYLKIEDNGTGISSEQQEEIQKKIAACKNQLTKNCENVELEIGGMGLVSVFARLYLTYNENLKFEIKSGAGIGTTVIIMILER